jgi:hypothetical protein
MDKRRASRPLSLTEADISSKRAVTRRSMLSALGLVLGAAAAAIAGPERATAQERPGGRSGCTDSDSGRFEDPEGVGVRCRQGTQPTGCSDDDSGPSGDPVDYGSRCQPRATGPRGCTDNDSGPKEDQPGLGIRCWI